MILIWIFFFSLSVVRHDVISPVEAMLVGLEGVVWGVADGQRLREQRCSTTTSTALSPGGWPGLGWPWMARLDLGVPTACQGVKGAIVDARSPAPAPGSPTGRPTGAAACPGGLLRQRGNGLFFSFFSRNGGRLRSAAIHVLILLAEF